MRIRKIVEVILTVSPLCVVLFLCGGILLRYPCNHSGGFYGYLFPILVMLTLSVTARFLLNTSILPVILSLLCLLAIFLCDWFNINVCYDEWIRRGMPKFGEFIIEKHVGNP